MLKVLLKYLLYCVLLYFFIYNPPFSFLPKSPKTILGILSLGFFLFEGFRKYILKFWKLFLVITSIVLYSFFRDFFGNSFLISSSNFTLYFDLYFLPIALLYLFKKMEFKSTLIDLILICGVVASILTIYAIVNPAVSDYFRYTLLQTNEFTELVAFRTFGLAEALTFTYGIIQGVIFCMLLFFKPQKAMWLFPVFFIAILFNARTGFAPVIFGLLLYVFYRFNIKQFLKIFLTVILILFLVPLIPLTSEQEKTLEWGLDFFYQIGDVAMGSNKSNSNTFSALFGEMLVLPNTFFEWLFGTGKFIFGVSEGKDSDVGYVLQLYYGGVFYLVLLFGIVFWIFSRAYKIKTYDKNAYSICLLLMITIIIVNVKGDIFSTNGLMRLTILLTMYFTTNKKKKNNLEYESFNSCP